MSEVYSANQDESSWIIDFAHVKKEFIAGGTAGAIGIFIGFPFDLVKVKLQAYPDKYKSAWSCFMSHVREDFRSLYRGCLVPILSQGFMNSLLFVGESTTIKILEPNLKPGQSGKTMNVILAGSAGGILQCVALIPSDVIKCTMQAQEMSANFTKQEAAVSVWTRTLNTIKFIHRQEGFGGFYKGAGATLCREIPSNSLYFFSYKTSRDTITKFQGLDTPSTSSILIGGAIAGAASWAPMYPFDVIKTNMQITNLDGTVHPYQNLSMIEVTKALYKQHGLKVFFRGLGTVVVRAFPVNAATFYFYEKIKLAFHFD